MPPGDDDEVVIRGEFEDAISAELRQAAREARETARALDETAVSGEAAGVGMDRASVAAGRLKHELEGVDRASEQHRLSQLRLLAAEQEATKIRQKGVLTAQETARVETMLAGARRDAKRAADDLTNAHKALDRATENVALRMLRAASSVGFLTAAFAGLKMVATVDIFTSLIGGVASFGAAAVAAAAGLAPLLGLVGGIPALGLAALSTFGMVALLTGGLLKGAQALATYGAGSQQAVAALRGMGPAQQQAAYDLAGFTFELKGLREEATRGALPYLEHSLENVRQILPHVRTGMTSLVSAVGDVAQQGTARIATWGTDLDTILSRNAQLVHTLGGSAIDALDVVRHLMVGAGPMVQSLAEHFAGAMERVDARLAANPEKIERYFARVEQRTLATLHVLSDYGHGVLSIFEGATPLTDHMGHGIEENAKHFREWTASAGGQNAIHKFFVDAIPVVDAMMHLLGQIGHSLGDLSRGSSAAGMINSISAILPPLTTALKLIEQIAGTVPGGNSVLALLFLGNRLGVGPSMLAKGTFGAGRGAFRFGQGVRGVGGAETSFAGRAGMRLGGRLGMLGGDAGALALGGGEAAAGAGVAEAAPLLANPVGLTVAAVAALAVGGYELYQHWKPFRDLVDWIGRGLRDGFGWVEHHAPQILKGVEIATWPISFPILAIIRHWDGVKEGLLFVWHHVLEPVAKFVGTVFVGEFKAVLWVVNKLIDGTKWLIDHVEKLPGVSQIGSGIHWLTGLYAGGPVEAHRPYLVGERGPEIFATAGSLRVVGGDGAELLSSATPGFVLPNEALRAITDVGARERAARALPVASPVGGDGWTLTPGEHVGGGEFEVRGRGYPPDLPPIVVGPNYIRDEIDLERAVAAGIDKWDRERRDRS